MTSVLFLCARNDTRSQMAEGFARARARPNLRVCSAGLEPGIVHPMAIKVMAEVGVDISGYCPKALAAVIAEPVDVVINVCERMPSAPIMLPGRPEWVNWNLSDPDGVQGAEDIVLRTFRDARDRIRLLVEDFFDRGYLDAFVEARERTQGILNGISDGIVVADLEGRVMVFNRAAEELTGYAAGDVINQPMDRLLPASAVPAPEAATPLRINLATRAGTPLPVLARVTPVRDAEGRQAGVLYALQNLVRDTIVAKAVRETAGFAGIIGRSPNMLEVFDLIRELAVANVPVLIQGESGTGKELVAAAIHAEGPRADRHFVPVNCGALPEALLESELFGHVKGAFTGAIRDKKGRFELADGGTIFLDEIGDISPAMQVKLLRVLQEGTFEHVGGEQTIHVDVRVISATHRDLTEEIAAGRFREDLFYRLSVVPMTLPPLRERRSDIPLLVQHALGLMARNSGRPAVRVAPAAMDVLLAQEWQGNVRELQNWLQFALVKCHGDEIGPEHLPPASRVASAAPPVSRRSKLTPARVREALQQTAGNKLEAARVLGVSRATLYRFLEESGMGA